MTRIFFDAPPLRELYLNDMEYTRFTMLLLPYFNEIKLVRTYRSGLIVNCSIEQAYFGKYKIEQSIPSISIMQILTEEEIEEFETTLDFFITFNYITCVIPHIEISSMVKQNDITELTEFLEHFSKNEIARKNFKLPCHQRTLEAVFYPNIMKLLYQDMLDEAAASLSYVEFEKRLIIQKAMLNDEMLVVLYDSSVKKQLLFSYEMEKVTYIEGRVIRTIHVLYIKDSDDIQLAQLIEKFRPDC